MPLTLIIGANSDGWSIFTRRRNDAEFQKNAALLYKRDNYTCQYCGFKAEKFQDIVNVDGNYKNSTKKNMVTSCRFCTMSQFLGCGAAGGKIIYFPELSQAELNNFVRVLFCSMAMHSEYADSAKSLYRNFRNRTQAVEQIFGEGSSEAEVFGQTLIDAGPAETQREALQNFRWLPNKSNYEKIIEYWATQVVPMAPSLKQR